MSDQEIEQLFYDVDVVFWKSAKEDLRVLKIVKRKNYVFRLSENWIKMETRGFLNKVRFLKRIFELRKDKKDFDKNIIFLAQSFNLKKELRLLGYRNKIIDYGYFPYFDYGNIFNYRKHVLCVTKAHYAKRNSDIEVFAKHLPIYIWRSPRFLYIF